MSLDALAFALANMVGTITFLSMRIGRVEKKLDRVLVAQETRCNEFERRVLTLEGRRATR